LSNCPKCQTGELTWDRTKNGKNWLKDVTGNWHTCVTPQKPNEISASSEPIESYSDDDRKLGKNYYHCKLCPEGAGWLFRLSKEEIEIHNGTLHPQGQDYSKMKIREIVEF
jgi:hypothetical protein